MPTVKSYGNTQVSTAALPSVRRSAAPTEETFGVEAGNKIVAIGAKLYNDEILRQDQVAVLEADRKMSEWENKRLYDPKDGALAKRGKDAFGLPDVVGKDFDSYRDEVRAALSNERQRAAFDRQAISRRSDIDKSLSRHVFTEVRKFDDTETENYLKNSRQSAISNSGDPDRIGLEIERQVAAITDFSSRNGLGAEYVRQKTAQARSDTHVGVIDRMLANGQDMAAKTYFDKVKPDIAGDDIAKVERLLVVANTEGQGLRGAGEIWSSMGPKSDTDPVNIDSMRNEAEKRYGSDPKIYKAVMDQIKDRANLHNAAQRERSEGNEAAVWDAKNKGASLATIMKMPEYLSLPGSKREQIKDSIIDRGYTLMQRGRADQAYQRGEQERAGWSVYWDYDSASVLSRTSENEIKNLASRMSPEQVNSLLNKKRSLEKKDDAVRSATIDEDQFKMLARGAFKGIDPYDTKMDKDHKAALGALKNRVESVIDDEQRASGKTLTRERKGQIMQSEIDKKVMIDEWGRDPEMPVSMVPKDKRGAVYVPIERIPKDALSEGINYMRSLGVIGSGTSDEMAARRFKDRLQRAYGLRMVGGTREEMETILKGAANGR